MQVIWNLLVSMKLRNLLDYINQYMCFIVPDTVKNECVQCYDKQ